MRMVEYFLMLIIVFSLVACDAEQITQTQTPLAPDGLDSLQIVGPDTIMISEKMIFYARPFGKLPSDYRYEWTIIDSPTTYLLVTLRDSCEYVAADVGAKLIKLQVRDLSIDSIIATYQKKVEVIRYTTGHILEKLASISLEFNAEVKCIKRDSTKFDTVFQKISLGFLYPTKWEVRLDTTVLVISTKRTEKTDWQETDIVRSGELKHLTSKTGDSLHYFSAHLHDFSTISRVIGGPVYYWTTQIQYRLRVENLAVKQTLESATQIGKEFVIEGDQVVELLKDFEYYVSDGKYSPVGTEHILISPPVYKGTPVLRIVATYNK